MAAKTTKRKHAHTTAVVAATAIRGGWAHDPCMTTTTANPTPRPGTERREALNSWLAQADRLLAEIDDNGRSARPRQ